MKLIKLPLKILALPLIVMIKLVCIITKVVTHLTCYIISPVMILVGIILLVMLSQERWTDVWACGAIEGICLVALFGVTWMIANMEDLNRLLLKFVMS